MEISIDGGNAGICEYLEFGKKAGREFSRDELDKRITLSGDFQTLDKILTTHYNPDRENNYLHLTFSFFEEDIDEATVQTICDEAKEFFMAGDKNDSFYCYAEAHMPKIKEYFNHKGDLVRRKPHIHMVVPNVNLTTEKNEDLLGWVENNRTMAHIDNFQEYINQKYGLSSPKSAEHIRTNPISKEDIINRYRPSKGEKQSEVKWKIYRYVMANPEIDSLEKLSERLEEDLNIKTKIRTPNSPSRPRYLHIDYKEGKGRGINLNYPIFHDEFLKNRDLSIAKQCEEKLAVPLNERAEKVQKWKEWDALTARFINSPALRRYFYNIEDRERKDFINKRLREDRQKKQERLKTAHVKHKLIDRGLEDIPDLENLQSIEMEELDGKSSQKRETANEMHTMRSRHSDGNKRQRGFGANEDLLHETQRIHMERNAENETIKLFAPHDAGGIGRSDGRKTGKASKTEKLVTPPFNVEREEINATEETKKVNWKKIIDNIDINALLSYCAHYYGLDISPYRAITNKQGANRVKTPKHIYSASDFLRKELNLNWGQAQIILQELSQEAIEEKPRTYIPENKTVWVSFYQTRRRFAQSVWEDYKEARQGIYEQFRFSYNRKLSYKQNMKLKEKLMRERKARLAEERGNYQWRRYVDMVNEFHRFKEQQLHQSVNNVYQDTQKGWKERNERFRENERLAELARIRKKT